jgi:hypothetical protein
MDGWMCSGWSSTPARGLQDGPNVHHGLSFDVTITYFCIRPGFTDETISVFACSFLRYSELAMVS